MDIRNTYAKNELPVSYSKKVMAMVKVTCSKFMLPLERPCHKEHICKI